MAVIPDVTALGGRPGTGIQISEPVNRSSEIVNRAAGGLGEDISVANRRITNARDAADAQSIKSQMTLFDIQTRREAAELDDYTQIEDYYRNKMAERVEPLFQGVSPRVRMGIEQDLAITVERGGLDMFGIAEQKEADVRVTGLAQRLTALKNEAANADRSGRVAAYDAGINEIRALEEAGILSHQKSWELQGAYSVDMVTQTLLSPDMEPEEAVAWLMQRNNYNGDPKQVALVNKLDTKYEGARTVINHSLDMVKHGRAVQNEDGSVSTFRGMIITDEDINDGRPTLVPTVWQGKVYDPNDEREMRIIMENVEAAEREGKTWPSAESVDAALQMEQEIHEALEPHAQLAQQPRTILDAIPDHEHLSLLKTWEAKVKEDDLTGRAWGWIDSRGGLDGDIGQMQREAFDIKDYKVRELVINRLATVEAQQRDETNRYAQDLYDLAETGGLAEMTPEIINRLDNVQLNTLKSIMFPKEGKATAVTNQTSNKDKANLILTMPRDWVYAMYGDNVNDVVADLGPSDGAAVQERYRAWATGQDTGGLSEGEEKRMREIAGTDDPDFFVKNPDYKSEYLAAVADFVNQKGFAPNQSIREDIMRDLSLKVRIRKRGFDGTSRYYGARMAGQDVVGFSDVGAVADDVYIEAWESLSADRRRDVLRSFEIEQAVFGRDKEPTPLDLENRFIEMLRMGIGVQPEMYVAQRVARTAQALQRRKRGLQAQGTTGMFGEYGVQWSEEDQQLLDQLEEQYARLLPTSPEARMYYRRKAAEQEANGG